MRLVLWSLLPLLLSVGCGPSAGEKRLALALAQCEEGRAADRREREVSTKAAEPMSPPPAAAEDKRLITAEKFDAINEGMSLAQVNDIFGVDGDLKLATNHGRQPTPRCDSGRTAMREGARSSRFATVAAEYSRVQYGLRP